MNQVSFSAGEVSPPLYARTDLARYSIGARTVRNFVPMRQGGVTNRPGTEFVSKTFNQNQSVRLMPFIFNQTGDGQSYTLEFGDHYIMFYQNGGNVTYSPVAITGVTKANPAVVISPAHGLSNGDFVFISGVHGMTTLNNDFFFVYNVTANTFSLKDLNPFVYGQPVDSSTFSAYTFGGTVAKLLRIASPYAQSDLDTLAHGQSGDILTIVHPSYPIQELRRASSLSWSITSQPLQNVGPLQNASVFGGGAGINQYFYYVTGVDKEGDETVLSSIIAVTSGLTAARGPSNPIIVSWVPVGTQAVYYKVFVSVVLGGVPGYIGKTTQLSFTDIGVDPDFSQQPPVLNSKIGIGAGNYPSCVGFVQQRRCFGATNNNPLGFWMSRTGSYDNFNIESVPDDSSPIFGSLAGEEVNKLNHITELKFMLMLTAGAELFVQGNGSGVVTPSAVNASTQSQYGSSPLKVLKAGSNLIFNQALGSAIRDFAFDFAIDGYRGNDLTIFASHLFDGYEIVDWCYQKVPDSIIWAVRSDGVLLSCTYIREQEVLAWAKHDLRGGFAEKVTAIPENGNYAVYVTVRRQIFYTNKWLFIERISSRLWTDAIDASYLDCFIKYDGRNTSVTAVHTEPYITITTNVNDGLSFTVGGTDYLGVIPAGTYYLDTLCTAVAAAMNAAHNNSYVCGVLISNNGSSRFSMNNDGTPANLNNVPTDPNYARSAWTTLGFMIANGGGPVWFGQSSPGTYISDDTAYTQQMVLKASNATFLPDMVGQSIFINDAQWEATQGVKGTQIRFLIQSYIDTTHVVVIPNRSVPARFQGYTFTTWAVALKNVTGLKYLFGQTVSVWADRYVVGSPLNNQVSNMYTVDFFGNLTLDKWYSVIFIGLPMISDLQTLDVLNPSGEVSLAQRKRIPEILAYVYNTRTFFAGSENPDENPNNTDDDLLFQLEEFKRGSSMTDYDQQPELVTDQDYVISTSQQNKNGRVFIRNVDPCPVSILAVKPVTDTAQQFKGRG